VNKSTLVSRAGTPGKKDEKEHKLLRVVRCWWDTRECAGTPGKKDEKEHKLLRVVRCWWDTREFFLLTHEKKIYLKNDVL